MANAAQILNEKIQKDWLARQNAQGVGTWRVVGGDSGNPIRKPGRYDAQGNYLGPSGGSSVGASGGAESSGSTELLAKLEAEIAAMPNEIISPEQKAALLAKRKAELAAGGQDLAQKFGDYRSGVQGGERRDIAADITGRGANLPIGLDIEVGQANEAQRLNKLNQQFNLLRGTQTDPTLAAERESDANAATLKFLDREKMMADFQAQSAIDEQAGKTLIQNFNRGTPSGMSSSIPTRSVLRTASKTGSTAQSGLTLRDVRTAAGKPTINQVKRRF